MTRITNILKDKIVKAALAKSGATAQIQAADDLRAAWSEDVRIEILGGADAAASLEAIQKKAAKLHESAPKDLRSDYFKVIKTRHYSMVNLAGANLQVRYSDWKIAPQRAVLLADNPLVKRFYDIEAAKKACDERSKAVSGQVYATLSQFGTIKSLIKAWPEAKELLPETLPESKPNLPAIKVSDLNALVGLPSAE